MMYVFEPVGKKVFFFLNKDVVVPKYHGKYGCWLTPLNSGWKQLSWVSLSQGNDILSSIPAGKLLAAVPIVELLARYFC